MKMVLIAERGALTVADSTGSESLFPHPSAQTNAAKHIAAALLGLGIQCFDAGVRDVIGGVWHNARL